MKDSHKEMKYGIRNSKMFLNEVYFWTDAIKDWKNLLLPHQYKEIVINSWLNLIKRNKIKIYGFVIMPNHLHLLWEMIELNGKEMPYASFNKFTSHQFLEHLRKNPWSPWSVETLTSAGSRTDRDPQTAPEMKPQPEISDFKTTNDIERKHRFWQRDPLAIKMDSREKAEQKLDYIHLNPLQPHWNLVDQPENYYWSSARYYETGKDDFGFLTHYMERF